MSPRLDARDVSYVTDKLFRALSKAEKPLTVKNIMMDGKFKTTLKGVESSTLAGSQVIRKELIITEPNLMTIGYRFLSQHKTVGTMTRKKIIFLNIDGPLEH